MGGSGMWYPSPILEGGGGSEHSYFRASTKTTPIPKAFSPEPPCFPRSVSRSVPSLIANRLIILQNLVFHSVLRIHKFCF